MDTVATIVAVFLNTNVFREDLPQGLDEISLTHVMGKAY
jgi:hypothetical protein